MLKRVPDEMAWLYRITRNALAEIDRRGGVVDFAAVDGEETLAGHSRDDVS